MTTKRFFSLVTLAAPLACGAVLLASAAVEARAIVAQDPAAEEVTLFVREQQSYSPGYAVGDIAIGDPAIADFRMRPGRREVLLFGKGEGSTRLTLWDQKGVKRHELTITVRSREEVKAEADLKELLKDFPGVSVRKLGEKLILSGTVATKADLDAVGQLASAAGAQNIVRLARAGVVTPAPAPGPVTGADGAPAPGPVGPPVATQVEYEVELLEANIVFSSGTYGEGIEPSGRSLFKQRVRVPIGGEVDLTIPGTAAQSRDEQSKSKAAASPISLRLKLRPTSAADAEGLTTFVLVETNLPVEGSKDPSIMRRARWELESGPDEPFGLAGAELLAMPVVAARPSKIGRVLGAAGSIPGGLTGDASSYIPSSSVVYYDKSKKTQLLAVFRPKLVAP